MWRALGALVARVGVLVEVDSTSRAKNESVPYDSDSTDDGVDDQHRAFDEELRKQRQTESRKLFDRYKHIMESLSQFEKVQNNENYLMFSMIYGDDVLHCVVNFANSINSFALRIEDENNNKREIYIEKLDHSKIRALLNRILSAEGVDDIEEIANEYRSMWRLLSSHR